MKNIFTAIPTCIFDANFRYKLVAHLALSAPPTHRSFSDNIFPMLASYVFFVQIKTSEYLFET